MRTTALVLLFVLSASSLGQAQGPAPPTPLTMVSPEGRRAVPTTVQSGQELIALDDVAALFGVSVTDDALTGGITVSANGRRIVASANQPVVSVDGRLVSLPSPVVRAGTRWLVPIDFLPRALGPMLDRPIELRRASRLLLVGQVTVPRVTTRVDAVGPPTRATLEISPAAPVQLSTDAGRVIVRVEADALDIVPSAGGGLIDQVRAGDQPGTVAVVLTPAAGAPRAAATTSGGVTRVSVEVAGAGAPAAAEAPPAAAPLSPPPASDPSLFSAQRAFQTVVLDPGHGGEDSGVRGDGLDEEQLVLDIARRVRQRLEARLGLRVLLTRDDDRAVGLDERAAAANNSKADLFLSLHANAAPAPGVAGAEVFYVRLDREGEDAARDAAEALTLPVLGGGRRAIDVVRWDLAQAPHVEDSAAFAVLLEDELRERVPMSARPLQAAPLRVLTGANMPAALVEIAYLTNPAQAAAAGREEFKNAVADALYEAIVRFRALAEEQRGP